ncbi:hypothetical protein RND81_09G084700 [Saponaria officinalis]|uniref:CCHC-type domain-containing protein n=1 Tax=Saponaria officinalis TaxID=3572 RepID=A0AAW1IK85_SAPOF
MLNIAKLEFVALDITGKNYLSWVLDAEIHLDAKRLGETIKEGNKITSQDKERYDHQKTVILSNAHYDWMHLRLQDFKSVSEYNSAMFRITSQLKLCGEKITDMDMLEKTYSTFHVNNVVLQTQYREKGSTKYSELISCLLVVEQNNELLMKNHESRLTGSTPLSESNVTSYNQQWSGSWPWTMARPRGRGGYFKKTYSHLQWNRKGSKCEKDKSKNVTNKCYRCGAKGYWSRVCRTPKHLVDLYLQSVKQKRKNIETNMVIEDGECDFDSGDATHLEVTDFFSTPEGN